MLRDLTCNHNKFEGKELERAEMLMERFENEEVAHILAIKKRDALPRSAPARVSPHFALCHLRPSPDESVEGGISHASRREIFFTDDAP